MERSEFYTDEFMLGNGCFKYPAAPTIPAEFKGRFSRSPIKSRMETYLQSTNEDIGSHHPAASQPTASTSIPYYLDQQAVHNNNINVDAKDDQERSPGWKLSLIKKTPIKPAVDTWAKYPSLTVHQQQLFPARTVSMVGHWSPWWLPTPLTDASSSLPYLIPSDDASLSQSADSSLSILQVNFNNRPRCEKELVVSVASLDRVENNNNNNINISKDDYNHHPPGYSTANTVAATTTAADSSDIVLNEDKVVLRSSPASTCEKDSLWSYWDAQQGQDKVQDKKQAEDQFSTQNTSLLTTVAATTTTLLSSMELTDPLGASSPSLPTPTQTTIFSHPSSPSSTPHGNVQSSFYTEVVGVPRPQGSHSWIVEQEAAKADTSIWTTPSCRSSTTSMTGLGLGVGLSYLRNYKSAKSTTPETVAVAEAMDRICRCVASSELNQQYTYLARSNRLLQLLHRDKKEKGNDEKNGDTRF
ncbi:hypothetical protein BGZ96_003637 [Linnemannia gamsii]|uniref:Uncharacterized protein n=1 Tax=Linnemannia gamsii TaxID=64522 RepID=A0ABQ7KG95_9FUNG|nr:hypothetical protein BGZ96_003637 [Linnemannia gamsii]